MKKTYFTTRRLAVIGLMSALVFIFTYIHFDIPTLLSKTTIHFGNVMCILSGLLFGPVTGGLSAGFGSMFFDLFDPVYAPQCWITFINKFMMGFVAGIISHAARKRFSFSWQDIVAAVCGSLTYTSLYLGKTFIDKYFIQGFEIETVGIDILSKLTVSLINGISAVIISLLLVSVLRPALKKVGLFNEMWYKAAKTAHGGTADTPEEPDTLKNSSPDAVSAKNDGEASL